LHVGGNDFPARLLDESAGGFGVLIDRRPDVNVGQTAQLRTDSSSFEVRVVYLSEVPASEGENGPNPEEPRACFRVGLVRLGEQLSVDERPTSLIAGSLHLAKSLQFSFLGECLAGGRPTVPGVLLALMILLIPLGLGSLFWQSRKSSSERTAAPSGNAELELPALAPSNHAGLRTPFAPEQSGRNDVENKTFRAGETSAEPRDAGESALGFRGGDQEPERSDPKSGQDVRDMVDRVAGATVLTLSEVVERLRLSDEQQAQIRRIVDGASESIRRLSLEAASKGMVGHELSQRREKLLGESRRRALDLLTPPQRAEWEKLVGEGRSGDLPQPGER
jgi:hypothetical protein